MTNKRPLADRFWEKVDVRSPSECWEWTACKSHNGYGFIKDEESKQCRAHRISYELNRGAVPEGMHVLHSCHNPGCVNPAHLRVGTHQDNMNDRTNAGRGAPQQGEFNPRSVLGLKQIAAIRTIAKRETARGLQSFLARWFGVSTCQISRIVTEERWRHTNA